MIDDDIEYGYDPDDDWYDDETSSPLREEPDCYACGDGGTVPAGRWYALLHRREWRPCRSCDPTRLHLLWWGLCWRWHRSRVGLWWRQATLRRRGVALSDEAPF